MESVVEHQIKEFDSLMDLLEDLECKVFGKRLYGKGEIDERLSGEGYRDSDLC